MFDDEKEREWMKSMARGDAKAFEALYAVYAKPISVFLYRMCYDRALTEDCVQEVFMRLWKSAARWRGESKVSTFIFQIAKNYGLNARDKAVRERARFSTARGRENDDADDHSAVTGEPEDEDANPETRMERQELRQKVREAVESLPDEQRIIVVLAQIENLTYREVAEILGLPLGTVKSRMAAAAETLRRRLARHVRA